MFNYSGIFSKIKQSASALSYGALYLSVALSPTLVHAQYKLKAGKGPFAKIVTWFQQLVDFMDGPFGEIVIVASLLLGVAVWVFAPKSGAVGLFLRGVVGGIIILNLAAWITSFR